MDESFFKKFKEDNIMDNNIIRTAVASKPLNRAPYTEKKKKKKKEKDVDIVENFNTKQNFMNLVSKNVLFDAILGAILFLVFNSSTVKNLICKYVTGFYKPVDNQYISNPEMPGTVIIKPNKLVLSMKGVIIMAGMFMLSYILMKTFFLTE